MLTVRPKSIRIHEAKPGPSDIVLMSPSVRAALAVIALEPDIPPYDASHAVLTLAPHDLVKLIEYSPEYPRTQAHDENIEVLGEMLFDGHKTQMVDAVSRLE
jgi:hypothetical protein